MRSTSKLIAALLVVSAFYTPLTSAVLRTQFIEHRQGAALVPKCDDCFTPAVNLPGVYTFFDRNYTQLFVSNNGIISFGEGISAFTPTPFPIAARPTIAPFWGDVDTRPCGAVYYRGDVGNNADVDQMIRAAFPDEYRNFASIWTFTVTWDDVGYFNQKSDLRNTFQAILTRDLLGNAFTIYQYLDNGIKWTFGAASRGIPAQVGFDAGDRSRFYAHPYSRTADVQQIDRASNVGVRGRFVFQVNRRVISAPPVVPVVPINPCLADRVAPTIRIPEDLTIEGGNPCPCIPAVTATDNVDPSPVVTYQGENRTEGRCVGSYRLFRKWTAVDNCGNRVEAVQTINVIDTQAPVLYNVPADISSDSPTRVAPAADVTAIDNVDPNVRVNYLGENRINGNCAGNYVIIRRWSAVDACGNIANASQTITILDIIAPLVQDPPGATIEAGAPLPPVPQTLRAIDNADPTPNITFNGEETLQGACAGSYAVRRTWTARDSCGNAADATQVIEVFDRTPPVLNTPENTQLECSDVIPIPSEDVSATDNADPRPRVNYLGQSAFIGEQPGSYELRRTWIAVDQCGNQAEGTQILFIHDTTAPVVQTRATPICLWPPNHRYYCFENVTNTSSFLAVEDNCAGNHRIRRHFVECEVANVGQLQGTGQVSQDCAYVEEEDKLCVRAIKPRIGEPNKIYYVTFNIEDGHGNSILHTELVNIVHGPQEHPECLRGTHCKPRP